MSIFGTHRIKMAALAATAVGTVVGGVAHTSADGLAQWVLLDTGCAVLSDDGGLTGTVQVCPEGNGNYDVYGVDAAGQWVFNYQIVTANWALPDDVPSPYPFDPTMGSNWEQYLGSGATPTSDNMFDAALGAALANSYGQPVCASVIGNICYLP